MLLNVKIYRKEFTWCRKFVSGSLQTQERIVIIKKNGNGIIFLNDKEKLTNTKINSLEKGIKIYPNPAKEYFILSYNLSDTENNKTLNITDVNGKIVSVRQISNNFGEIFVKTDSFKKGIYFLKLGEYIKKADIE